MKPGLQLSRSKNSESKTNWNGSERAFTNRALLCDHALSGASYWRARGREPRNTRNPARQQIDAARNGAREEGQREAARPRFHLKAPVGGLFQNNEIVAVCVNQCKTAPASMEKKRMPVLD